MCSHTNSGLIESIGPACLTLAATLQAYQPAKLHQQRRELFPEQQQQLDQVQLHYKLPPTQQKATSGTSSGGGGNSKKQKQKQKQQHSNQQQQPLGKPAAFIVSGCKTLVFVAAAGMLEMLTGEGSVGLCLVLFIVGQL